MAKTTTKWIADAAVTKDKLNADVVLSTGGLQGAAGTALSIKPDSTTGATVCPITTAANGAGVTVDNTTIEHTTGTLGIKDGSIGDTQLDGNISLSELAEAVIQADGGQAFTANQGLGGFKLTNVGAPTDGGDAANKTYVDNKVSNTQWKTPVDVPNLISDADQSGAPPVGPSGGDAYIVNNWGVSYNNGDLVEYDGVSDWVVIAANDAGNPADGTRAFITGIDGSGAAGSFAGQDEKVAEYTSGSGWAFTSPSDGDAHLVNGDGGYYENNGYVWNTDASAWEQFTGAGQINAGNGLSKSGNTFNVNPDATTGTTEINGNDEVAVPTNGIGATQVKLNDTYDYATGGGTIQVTTQAPADNSTKAASTAYVDAAVVAGVELRKQEMHKVTSGEVTAGHFTLSQNPSNAQCVTVDVYDGIRQVNKQVVGGTGVTPDFDVLNTNELHINNNGAATGLSEVIEEDDVLIITYSY